MAVAAARTRFQAAQLTVVVAVAVVFFTPRLPRALPQLKVARAAGSTTLAELQATNTFLASA
jgi:hypothetical protein